MLLNAKILRPMGIYFMQNFSQKYLDLVQCPQMVSENQPRYTKLKKLGDNRTERKSDPYFCVHKKSFSMDVIILILNFYCSTQDPHI